MPKKNNPDVKIANELTQFSPEDLKELKKCKEDPIHCIKTYFKIKHPTKGLVPFELYEYQEEVIKRALKNRYNCILFPRQSGKCSDADTKICVIERYPNKFLGWLGSKILWMIAKAI